MAEAPFKYFELGYFFFFERNVLSSPFTHVSLPRRMFQPHFLRFLSFYTIPLVVQ